MVDFIDLGTKDNITFNAINAKPTYKYSGSNSFIPTGYVANITNDATTAWTGSGAKGANGLVVKNCKFVGAPNATFNNCTFNSDGKAILLYGTANTKLTVNGCVFNDNGGLTSLKAAIEIGNDYGTSYTLTVTKTVVNGYEINDKGINTGTELWANKNSMSTDKLNVVVDGVEVY